LTADRPRWLLLTQYYAPEIGAPQIRLRCVVRELRRHGIDVEVLTALPNYPAGRVFPGYRGRWTMREEIDGAPVHRTWVYPGTGRSPAVRLANYFSFTFSSLIVALFGPRPDVLFVESQPLSLGIVALTLQALRGVPYIYNVPDLQVDVARQMGFLRSPRLLRRALSFENRLLLGAALVSTVTRRFMEHFAERGVPRERITFLPNGADTEFLRPRPPDRELLARWDLAGKKVFAYVGTHAFYHGLDTLLDAATRLRSRRDITFLLIGDGPERSRLREVARSRGLENVVFGESPYEEMDRLYSIAWASVALLRNLEVARGMRLSKIFPSLACGVPVIYAGTGEAAELLVEHGCGEAIEPENPVALADAIERLAADPVRRGELGRLGRQWVEAEYSWKGIVERWLRESGFVASEPEVPVNAAATAAAATLGPRSTAR
jgi:colanic acid biosynthesis glycosyl transferase WcaI